MTTSASGQTCVSFGAGITRGTAMRVPTASSSRRSQPSTVRNGWLALAVTWRPDASRSSNTSLTPVGKAWVIVAGTMRRSCRATTPGCRARRWPPAR